MLLVRFSKSCLYIIFLRCACAQTPTLSAEPTLAPSMVISDLMTPWIFISNLKDVMISMRILVSRLNFCPGSNTGPEQRSVIAANADPNYGKSSIVY